MSTAEVHGRHRAVEAPPPRRPRKRAVIALSVVIVFLVVAVAVALSLLRAPISGNVSAANVGIVWNGGPQQPAPTVVCTDASGTIQIQDVNLATLSMTEAFTDGTCTYTASVRSKDGATMNARVVGIDLPGLPTGWTAALAPASCGATTVPFGAPVNAGTVISFTVTMGPEALPGGSGVINGPASGIRAVPAVQFQSSMCA